MLAEAVVHPISVTGVLGTPAANPIVSELRPGREVELIPLGIGEALHLRVGDEIAECETEGRSSWRLREACSDRSIERVCVVQDVRIVDDKAIVTVAARELGVAVSMDQIRLLIDERIVETIGRIERAVREVDDARAWLTARCVLPPVQSGRRSRLLIGRAAREADDQGFSGAFSIIGDGIRLDVRLQRDEEDGTRAVYFVTRVSRIARGRTPAVRAVIEADVLFVDQAADAQLTAAIEAQVGAIMRSETTFLGIWKRYQELEVKLKLEQASEHPTVPYRSCEQRNEGLYRLEIPSDHAKLHRLSPGDEVGVLDADRSPHQLAEIMLGTIARIDRLDQLETEAPDRRPSAAGAHARELGAVVDRIEQGGAAVFVRCDAEPPASGFLGASIMGDLKMQARRSEALGMIARDECKMRQLALIIEETGPLTTRRTKAEKPVTQRLLDRVFTNAEGKSRQLTPRQRLAIDAALNTPDIAVIQGPPGTGKTTVMRAIIERIHELNSKDPGRRDRFLVTGFQHDAVENATEGMEVDGVPVQKAGGRRRTKQAQSDDADLQLDEFVRRVESGSTVLARGTLGLHAQLRAIEDEIAYCVGESRSAAANAAVIDGVLARFGSRISRDLRESLGALGDRMRRESEREPSPDAVRLERAIRAIRCTEASFADDGPRNAQVALALLERAGTSLDLSVLERAAAWSVREAPPFVVEIDALRQRLLLAHARRRGVESLTYRNEDLLELLGDVRDEVQQQVAQTSSADEIALARFQEGLYDREALREVLKHYSIVVGATCQQSVSKVAIDRLGGEPAGLVYENVLCDEAARANPLDLLVPMSRAKRRIILVGDHRQLPHIVEDEIEARLLSEQGPAASDGAVDGKSAEEVRSEFSKALGTSMFEKIYTVLRDREEKDGIRRAVTLNEQFRMHPLLGDFVSEQFYPPHERFGSPRPASDFAHDFAPFAGRCAAWHDVPGEPESMNGKSRIRPLEAREIARLLKPMLDQAIATNAKATFGIISFYKAQVAEVNRELVRVGIKVAQDDGEPQLAAEYAGRVRVGTVDAFQGREFDVVFLSVVRSNRKEDPVKRYGHLMSPNRMCVSMSRQKRLLVVVGDRRILGYTADRDVPALRAFVELADSESRRAQGGGGVA
jgi:hypothetical protein